MVSRSLILLAESNAVNCFRAPKSGKEEGKLLKETVPKSTVIVTSFSYLHSMLCMNLDMCFSWTYVDSCM